MAAKSRLGKGLGALFPDLPGEVNPKVDSNIAGQTPDHHASDNTNRDGKESTQIVVSRETTKSHSEGKQLNSADPQTGATANVNTQSSSNIRSEAKKEPVSATLANSIATMKNSDIVLSGEKNVNDKRTVGAGGSAGMSNPSKGKKRAAMPGIGDIVHPSDLFFGESVSVPAAAPQSPSDVNHGRQTAEATDVKQQSDDKVSRETSDTQSELKPVQGGYLAELGINDIGPNAYQPRTIFDEDELNELAASIKEVGVLQPIVVRKRADAGMQGSGSTSSVGHGNTTYELIMGERRWRASQLAGLQTIPAIVKTTADDDMLRDALLENLHRVALNPLEEAAAYQQMIDEFGLTQAALSKSVSKSRPQIANTLRLLNLPAAVQKKVAAGILSAGHARALLALTDEAEMDKLATRIIAEGLSVRSTEEIVAMKIAQGEQPKKARANKNNPWANSPIQQNLENRFDTKVSIKGSQKHGRIEIVFSSPEDMNRILDLLMAKDTTSSSDSDWK